MSSISFTACRRPSRGSESGFMRWLQNVAVLRYAGRCSHSTSAEFTFGRGSWLGFVHRRAMMNWEVILSIVLWRYSSPTCWSLVIAQWQLILMPWRFYTCSRPGQVHDLPVAQAISITTQFIVLKIVNTSYSEEVHWWHRNVACSTSFQRAAFRLLGQLAQRCCTVYWWIQIYDLRVEIRVVQSWCDVRFTHVASWIMK